jgi:hypothetical protein
MDATPYGYSFLISAKACSHAAYTGSRRRTGFVCTDNSDNIDGILALIAWCEENETATESLLPINQSINGIIN